MCGISLVEPFEIHLLVTSRISTRWTLLEMVVPSRLEVEIADYEQSLSNYVNAEETKRTHEMLEARKSDLDLDLSKQRFSYPTARAHTLIRHAAAKGTQGALVHALYRLGTVLIDESARIYQQATTGDRPTDIGVGLDKWAEGDEALAEFEADLDSQAPRG